MVADKQRVSADSKANIFHSKLNPPKNEVRKRFTLGAKMSLIVSFVGRNKLSAEVCSESGVHFIKMSVFFT